MKNYNYATAINQLGLNAKKPIGRIKEELIPERFRTQDFVKLFLPYVRIYGDSREQDKWIQKACEHYGIEFQWCSKKGKSEFDNLKEGDYSFSVIFGDKEYNYIGEVSFERKGSVGEFYNNCIADRKRIKREFVRFNVKRYSKVVLMLQFGEKITDLIGMKFSYYKRDERGIPRKVERDCGHTLYSTVLSWKQPNNNDFDLIMSANKETLFMLMLQECFYYFRQELRLECIEKNLIENNKKGDTK